MNAKPNEVELKSLLSKLVSLDTTISDDFSKKPDKSWVDFVLSQTAGINANSEVLEKNEYYSLVFLPEELDQNKPTMLFLGHVDVVPAEASHWRTHPLRLVEKDGKYWGRGVADMKGGFVALMLAMRSFFKENPTRVVQPIVAFTSDEEIGGRNGASHVKEFLSRLGIHPKYVVTGEVSNLELITRRRNLLQAIITFSSRPRNRKGSLEHMEFRTYIHEGESLHAAYFRSDKDQHALIEAARFASSRGVSVVSINGDFLKSNSVPRTVHLTYIRPDSANDEVHIEDQSLTGFLNAVLEITNAILPVEAPSDYGITITPNFLEHADSRHKAWLDIRAMINNKDEVENVLTPILEKYLTDFHMTIKCSGRYIYTPEDSPLVLAARSVLEQNGKSPQLLERGGATDGRHFAAPGVHVIDLGPIGGNLHGANEWVDKKSLLTLVRAYQMLPQAIDNLITAETRP